MCSNPETQKAGPEGPAFAHLMRHPYLQFEIELSAAVMPFSENT